MGAIQREVIVKLEKLEQAQGDLGMKIAEELARIGSRRAILDELDKNTLQATLGEGNQIRLRVGSRLDKSLEGCRKSINMDSDHPVEMSCAEINSDALKIEDCEGISHSLPGTTVSNELFPDKKTLTDMVKIRSWKDDVSAG